MYSPSMVLVHAWLIRSSPTRTKGTNSVKPISYLQNANIEEADSTDIHVNQDGLLQFQAGRNSCDPDSCWSWLVCGVCAFCNIVICGLTYSYGILFPSLLDEFKQGKAKTGILKMPWFYFLFCSCLKLDTHTTRQVPETNSFRNKSLRVVPTTWP